MVKLGHNNITTYLVFRPPMHLMTLLQIKLDIHMTTPKTSFYYDSNKLGSIAKTLEPPISCKVKEIILNFNEKQTKIKTKKFIISCINNEIARKNKLKAKTKIDHNLYQE